MIRCTILGHDNVYNEKEFKETHGHAPVFNHCQRCRDVTGVFIKLHDKWAYFK